MKANAVRDRRRHHAGRDDRDRETYPGPHSAAQALWSRAMAEAQRLPWSACGVGPYAARSCIGMRRMASAGRRSSASAMSTRSRKPRLRQPVRFVVCIENSGYPASLELHKIYRTVPDQSATREGDLRIVDESGEDYLYPAEWFVAVAVPRRVRTSLLRRLARLQSA